MIDHFGLSVADYGTSRQFYDHVLQTLGYRRLTEFETPAGLIAGYGSDKPDFWISAGGRCTGKLHMAFTAKSRDQVDAFHAAALAHGEETMAPLGCAKSIIPTTTAHSCSTPTVTT